MIAKTNPPHTEPDWPLPVDEHADTSHPARDFARLRRALIVLLVATVVLPSGFLLFYGFASWHKALDDANGYASRSARIAEEQALKVFELNDDVRDRVLHVIHDAQAQGNAIGSSAFSAELRSIAAPFPHLAAVSVYDAGGRLVATSNPYAGIPDDIAQTRAFRDAAHWNQGDYVSAARPLHGRRDQFFATVTPRHDADGRFDGIVEVAVRSSYFDDFYREIASGGNVDGLALLRSDGAVLSSYPPPSATRPMAPVPATLRALKPEGIERVRVDDGDAIAGFRRVGDQRVYVTGTVRLNAVFSRWLERISIVSAFAIVPSVALFLVAFAALRRLDSEEKAWRRWQNEALRRRIAEEDYRHALKMESLGRLTGSVAHDFNNLLMVVSANARVIRLQGGTGMDKQWHAIERAVQTGEALTRRLLSVSRKQPTRAERVDLKTRLTEWKGLIETSAGAQCDVRISVPDNAWPVLVDATDLQLALINLVANARDALRENGRIAITVGNLRGEQVAHAPARDLVRIAVSDNGCGMSPEVAARAFEPFFTTKDPGKGTGLGLPQVYAFCKQAGGHALITSHPGVGTTVAMFLPAAVAHADLIDDTARRTDAATHAGDPLDTASAGSNLESSASVQIGAAANEPRIDGRLAAMPTAATSTPLNLLLVEDDEAVAEATAAVLNLEGHRVTTAFDARSALAIYHEHANYDAVISDVTMPGGMNGIDLALALRHVDPALPVILVTGHTDKLSEAQREGLIVLPKPVNFEALRSVLPHAA
jgi:signal transduction histidine kinase/CheY-like chemotaxis protein